MRGISAGLRKRDSWRERTRISFHRIGRSPVRKRTRYLRGLPFPYSAVIQTRKRSPASIVPPYVTYCYHKGLVEEKFSYVLAPQTPLQRGELAEILYRIYAPEEEAA